MTRAADSTTSATPEGGPSRRSVIVAALCLFFSLFVLYNASGTVLDEGDAVPTTVLPAAVLETGSLSFGPDEFPELFKWRSRTPFVEKDDFFITSWNQRFGDRRAEEWRFSSHLELNGHRYYVVESKKQHTYVSTFGPIPGLVLLPFMAPFLGADPELYTKLALRDTIARLCSSSLVAGTAVLIFLAALRFTTRRNALLVAAVYGLGTCAWAVSSQNMWQQTVNQLLLTLGAFFVTGDLDRRRTALLAGLALGTATACRATGAVTSALVAAYLLVYHRRSLLPFLIGAAQAPIAIGVYNQHYFGSPLSFAQELVGHAIAQEKTGSTALWQTPLWKGAAGLLVSPGRGLLVFSPVLAPAFVGMVRVLRDARFRALRPLAVGALVTMAMQCMWFDWWGGHAYGYRPWLDAVPCLALLLLPVIERITLHAAGRAAFAVAFGWSIFVQALGALSYDRSWNLRELHVVRTPSQATAKTFFTAPEAERFAAASGGKYLGPSYCDIDLWFCRYRLWSLEDNPIQYQLTHFDECRARRFKAGFGDLGRSW